jgi:hypothetical protein
MGFARINCQELFDRQWTTPTSILHWAPLPVEPGIDSTKTHTSPEHVIDSDFLKWERPPGLHLRFAVAA